MRNLDFFIEQITAYYRRYVTMEPNKPSWDDYFMALAIVVSQRSPDPSTKHGSVIVGAENRILGLGYNGFPRNGPDHQYPLTRPEKYKYMVHSEPNALANCTIRPDGATLYVTGRPCSACFLGIIQNRIDRVVYGQVGSACVDEAELKLTDQLATNHRIEMFEYKGRPHKILHNALFYLGKKDW